LRRAIRRRALKIVGMCEVAHITSQMMRLEMGVESNDIQGIDGLQCQLVSERLAIDGRVFGN
jgi:hypothetical protein